MQSSKRRGARTIGTAAADSVAETSSSPFRLIQHKEEAFWFYRFLSQVYDHIVNPGHWTVDMRTEALEPALLHVASKRPLKVIDVGGGTGFSTTGIVEAGVPGESITLVDQSPHQLSKAKAKKALEGVTIQEGDAENLDFPTNSFDRYVSCGSIEYWPDPQRGICEAFRVIKPGGLACMVGPVHPTHPVSKFFADSWMLFPTEEEYLKWFEQAGFSSIKLKRIGPKWYRGCRKHGLIMGCSVTGVKKLSEEGESPLKLGPMKEASRKKAETNKAILLARLILGSLAGFYYFVVPVYMWIKDKVLPRSFSFV